MDLRDAFPDLADDNHRVTSPESRAYNCIAWAAGESGRWWQPGRYWPIPVAAILPGDEGLRQAYATVGFVDCADGDPKAGFEKVALYSDGIDWTHAARQLPSGKWTSKLGNEVDIEHDSPANLEGTIYGRVFGYMKRSLSPTVLPKTG
jgi:hypothetical protein